MISPLRTKRFFMEMSIYDVSKVTGIDPPKISLIERDLKKARDDEKEKFAIALKCTVDEIFLSDDTQA